MTAFPGAKTTRLSPVALAASYRTRQPRGAASRTAKLTDAQARAILDAVRVGASRAEQARQHGITRTAVSLMASGKRWAHLRGATP